MTAQEKAYRSWIKQTFKIDADRVVDVIKPDSIKNTLTRKEHHTIDLLIEAFSAGYDAGKKTQCRNKNMSHGKKQKKARIG